MSDKNKLGIVNQIMQKSFKYSLNYSKNYLKLNITELPHITDKVFIDARLSVSNRSEISKFVLHCSHSLTTSLSFISELNEIAKCFVKGSNLLEDSEGSLYSVELDTALEQKINKAISEGRVNSFSETIKETRPMTDDNVYRINLSKNMYLGRIKHEVVH